MILLTVDTSPQSECAIPVATDLATRFHQPLRILLVLDGPLRHHFDEIARGFDVDLNTAAQDYLDGVATTIRTNHDLTVDTIYQHAADAGAGIVTAAGQPDIAMLVMATHGRSGLSRWLTGSVTEHVIRHAPVPVVVVPAHQPDLDPAI